MRHELPAARQAIESPSRTTGELKCRDATLAALRQPPFPQRSAPAGGGAQHRGARRADAERTSRDDMAAGMRRADRHPRLTGRNDA